MTTAKNNPQIETGMQAGARPALVQTEPAAPVIDQTVTVIAHQDEIGAFLKTRNFGKDEGRIRAIFVEFIKFQDGRKLKVAA